MLEKQNKPAETYGNPKLQETFGPQQTLLKDEEYMSAIEMLKSVSRRVQKEREKERARQLELLQTQATTAN